MTLQEFIDECRSTVTDRRAEESNERAREQTRYNALFTSVMSDAIRQMDTSFPAVLRPFVSFAGDPPQETELRRYPAGYLPTEWQIVAEGLELIEFTTTGNAGRLSVVEIEVGDSSFGGDWIEAVAFASGLELVGGVRR